MKQENLNKKIVIIIIFIVFVSLFKGYNLGQYLTLSYFKESRATLAAFYAEHHLITIASYIVVYIIVTSLSLPGAAVLTLAGGALFGFWIGTIAVSFASTIGATLACFVSRFLLREWVQGKFADKLKTVNEGIANEGAFYLFTLRLIPLFPFFIINVVMGLTKMRLFTFFWVSQVGMLLGTMVYVNAGKELARINSFSGIVSPRLIISFVILGLFPITTKKILGLIKRRKHRGAV